MLQTRGDWGPIRQYEMGIARIPSELPWEYPGEHSWSPANIPVARNRVIQLYLVKVNCTKGRASV